MTPQLTCSSGPSRSTGNRSTSWRPTSTRPEIQRRALRRGSRTIVASSSPGSMPQRRLGKHEILGWQNRLHTRQHNRGGTPEAGLRRRDSPSTTPAPLHRKPNSLPILEGSWLRTRAAPLHLWAGEVGKRRVLAGGEHAG